MPMKPVGPSLSMCRARWETAGICGCFSLARWFTTWSTRARAAKVIITEFAGVHQGIISCDRYSGYKRFARLNPGVKLAFCWAHQRRDFLKLANSYPESAEWALQWVDRIGNLYHLNAVRLTALKGSPERVNSQWVLEQAVQQMGAHCAVGVASHETFPPAAKVLESMTAHWAGLTVFVAHPWVAMDNNAAERSMRSPVVGRKNFSGSGAQGSAELAATTYSLFATMKLWGLNLRNWLTAYLQACADNGNAKTEVNFNVSSPTVCWTLRLCVVVRCECLTPRRTNSPRAQLATVCATPWTV